MAWKRIDDNAQAWELLLAGLLWFGEPDKGNHHMEFYGEDTGWTTKDRWMGIKFDGSGASLPNYIQVDD